MTQIERLQNQIASLEAEQSNLKDQYQRTEGALTVCRHMLGALLREKDEMAKELANVAEQKQSDEPSKE